MSKLVRGLMRHTRPPSPHFARTDPLDRGLVGEWRFDPASGLVLRDYSGRGNHGDNDGADWITSEVGPGLRFVTANTDFVDTGVERIGGTGLFAAATEQFTVEMHFRIANNETGYVVARLAVAGNRTFGVWFERPVNPNETPAVFLRTTFTRSGWGYDDGEPHVLHVIWDGSAATLYGDGGKDTLGLGVGAAAEDAGQRIIFGARDNGTGFFLDGDIFGVRIWDRALSAGEALARYQVVQRRTQELGGVWAIPMGKPPAVLPPLSITVVATDPDHLIKGVKVVG